MSLPSNIKVPMPKEKIFISDKNVREIPYVYYVIKTYRNEKGQPTNDRISIGRKDLETGLLIPNENYFNVFECHIKVIDKEGNVIYEF